jgi:predicted translin family RNA/ssDNA-binding protein
MSDMRSFYDTQFSIEKSNRKHQMTINQMTINGLVDLIGELNRMPATKRIFLTFMNMT